MVFEYNKFLTTEKQYQILLDRNKYCLGIYKRFIKMDLFKSDTGAYIYAHKLNLKNLLNYELIASNVKITIIYKDGRYYTIIAKTANTKQCLPLETIKLIENNQIII